MDRFFLFRVTGQAGRTVARFASGPFQALAVITLMAVAIPVGVGMPWSGGSTTVQAATAAATFAITAPGAAQPVGTPFSITVNLTAVTFEPVNSPSWGGYDIEMAYDNTLLSVNNVAPTLCSLSGWGNPANAPNVVTGCAFQNSTSTGVLETITMTCQQSGTSALRHRSSKRPDDHDARLSALRWERRGLPHDAAGFDGDVRSTANRHIDEYADANEYADADVHVPADAHVHAWPAAGDGLHDERRRTAHPGYRAGLRNGLRLPPVLGRWLRGQCRIRQCTHLGGL